MEKIKFIIIGLMGVIITSCKMNSGSEEKLPYLGRFEIVKNETNNTVDTLWHKVGDFSFVDQDSALVTPETFKDKIYVTDFFFTSCPDICPIMKTQMTRVYDKYLDNPEVLLLSHTIDPKHDSVAVLKEFAERLLVSSDKWKFVTGEKEEIYRVGQTHYMASVADEGSRGFVHSGRFFLIDKDKHVRGAYDGTNEEEVSILLRDIDRLLKEQGSNK
ncbi:MAG: SCO family protein [Cyclobacteriaceae bacterium]|nr:SCO family protein [Cyclobacteriaceae bacterium]